MVKECHTYNKTGIITLHHNTNYGANMQAFATCKFANEHNYNCEIIDYRLKSQESKTHVGSWLLISWRNDKSKSLKNISAMLCAWYIVAVVSLSPKILVIFGGIYNGNPRMGKGQLKFRRSSGLLQYRHKQAADINRQQRVRKLCFVGREEAAYKKKTV